MNAPTAHTIIAEYNSRRDAEESVLKLTRSGFDMENFTLVGKNYYSQESILGYYNLTQRVKKYGIVWAVNGGVFSMFFSLSYLLFEGFYNILVVPAVIVYMIVVWVVIFGIAGCIWGAFRSIGKPGNSRLRYKLIFKAEAYLLIAKATEEDVNKMHEVLDGYEKEYVKDIRVNVL